MSEYLTKKLPGHPPHLEIYAGMRAILTINRDASRGFINGVIGVVRSWSTDPATGQVATIEFLVNGASEPIFVRQ